MHATSGAAFFDYIVADAVALPPEHAPLFVESVLALPPSLLPNSHSTLYAAGEAGGVQEQRADGAHAACEWADATGRGRVGLLALYEHYKVEPGAMTTWLAIAKDTQAALVMQAGAFPALTTPVLQERVRRALLPQGTAGRSTRVRRGGRGTGGGGFRSSCPTPRGLGAQCELGLAARSLRPCTPQPCLLSEALACGHVGTGANDTARAGGRCTCAAGLGRLAARLYAAHGLRHLPFARCPSLLCAHGLCGRAVGRDARGDEARSAPGEARLFFLVPGAPAWSGAPLVLWSDAPVLLLPRVLSSHACPLSSLRIDCLILIDHACGVLEADGSGAQVSRVAASLLAAAVSTLCAATQRARRTPHRLLGLCVRQASVCCGPSSLRALVKARLRASPIPKP